MAKNTKKTTKATETKTTKTTKTAKSNGKAQPDALEGVALETRTKKATKRTKRAAAPVEAPAAEQRSESDQYAARLEGESPLGKSKLLRSVVAHLAKVKSEQSAADILKACPKAYNMSIRRCMWMGFVEKTGRGMYRITPAGRKAVAK